VSKARIVEYFDRVAPDWDAWHRRNAYYHARAHALIRGMVPPGARVLEIGCGTGDLLAALRPSRGVGLNVSERLTGLARAKYPALEFHTADVDAAPVPDGFRPEYVVLNNMLDYVYDVWDAVQNLGPVLGDLTLLVATTSNPLWAPILKTGSRLRLRVPDSPRNFLTNRDLLNVLELQGLRVVEQGMALPVPKRVPLLGPLVNAVLPEIPALRYLSSLQYVAARPRVPRPPLACSVIVPCHDEEGNIAECIRRVPPLGARTEIVVVDDGSSDTTRRLVRATMRDDARVRLIAFDRNQGKAAAVRAGCEAATGDVLIILDADMAVRPEEMVKFVKPLQDGVADFVNGTRLVYPMEGRAMKMANYLGNKAFCLLLSAILRQRVSDTLCGTKAFFRRDYLRMPVGGRERWGDFDLLLGAARLKLRILEIPIHYRERRAGESKMRVSVEGWRFLRASLSGWRMLRFPDAVPWVERFEPARGWVEVGADVPERVG